MPGEVYFRHIVFDFAQEENVSRLLLLLVCGSEGSQYKDLNDMPYELWPSSSNSWRNCTILSELCVKFTSNLTSQVRWRLLKVKSNPTYLPNWAFPWTRTGGTWRETCRTSSWLREEIFQSDFTTFFLIWEQCPRDGNLAFYYKRHQYPIAVSYPAERGEAPLNLWAHFSSYKDSAHVDCPKQALHVQVCRPPHSERSQRGRRAAGWLGFHTVGNRKWQRECNCRLEHLFWYYV